MLNPFTLIRRWLRENINPDGAEKRAHNGATPTDSPAATLTYSDRLRQETSRFAGELDINNLPAIFHYWSNKYLRPELEAFGYKHPEHFFETEFAKIVEASPGRISRFASLGSGNGDAEVRIAQGLLARGLTEFCIDCLELTPEMNVRTTELALQSGVAAQIRAVAVDLNDWNPEFPYAAIMANQSLHHMVELERIFDTVRRAMASDGRFLVSDMIGRNGHQRWPEALKIVREFWSELPGHYRHNLQLNRTETNFLDWDCSSEGFEGIRSQDILALLHQRFHFEVFLPFANVIDPFIDRSFGHHFDAEAEWDRNFIDRVHARDEQELRAGNIKPTHLIAVLTKEPTPIRRWRAGFSPETSIRH
jgi:SAM-dependent methyltransferase